MQGQKNTSQCKCEEEGQGKESSKKGTKPLPVRGNELLGHVKTEHITSPLAALLQTLIPVTCPIDLS